MAFKQLNPKSRDAFTVLSLHGKTPTSRTLPPRSWPREGRGGRIRQIVFLPTPAENHTQLYLYIADEAGPKRAGGYLAGIEEASMSLQTFPERGTVRERMLPVLHIIGFERSAAIAFSVIGDMVEVLRILRHRQDIPNSWPGD